MKKINFLLCFFLIFGTLLSSNSFSATYTTGDVSVAIPDVTGAYDTCQMITVPASEVIATMVVEVAIDHTYVGDLAIEVTSPLGTALTLMHQPDGGDDLISTLPLLFDDSAPDSAENMGSLCPGNGPVGVGCPSTYAPDGDYAGSGSANNPLAQGTNFADFNGEDAVGNWTLCVADIWGGDTGNLVTWSLIITPAGAPLRASVQLDGHDTVQTYSSEVDVIR